MKFSYAGREEAVCPVNHHTVSQEKPWEGRVTGLNKEVATSDKPRSIAKGSVLKIK